MSQWLHQSLQGNVSYELPPEIRTLTLSAICSLLIFNTKEIGHLETIQAIKELREINKDGLKEAKDAVDLLADFGLKWRDSDDKP